MSVNKVIVADGSIEAKVYELLIGIVGSGTVIAENMTTNVKTEYYKDIDGTIKNRPYP